MDNNNVPHLNTEAMNETSDSSGTSTRPVNLPSPAQDRFVANPELRRSAFAGFVNASERNRTAFQAPAGGRLYTAPPTSPVLQPVDTLRPPPQQHRGRRDAMTPLDAELARAFRLNAARGEPLATVPPYRLSEADIQSIPERTITASDLDDEGEAQCNICIEPLNVGDLVCYLICKHFYHRECIVTWFASSNTCPSCRKVYVPPPSRDRKDDDRMRRNDSLGGGGSSGAVAAV